jgi:formate/nitrite transporter FocA (FNT family)
MTPVESFALTIACGLVVCVAWWALKLAMRALADTVEYLFDFGQR